MCSRSPIDIWVALESKVVVHLKNNCPTYGLTNKESDVSLWMFVHQISSLSRSNCDFVSDTSHHYGYHFSQYCRKTSLFYVSISKIGLTCSASMSLHTHLTTRATRSHNSMLPTCLLFFIVLLGRTYSCCFSSLVECP
jgi:hypothetical protein